MNRMTLITRTFIQRLRAQFKLDWQGIHGAPHWARVRANGLRLTERTHARLEVVELFAFLHDSRRHDDYGDPLHGARAAQYVEELRGDLFEIDDEGFELLRFACVYHSDGLIDADITIQTCWDADRLDIGRVGIRPDPLRLCTAAAREPEVLDWAYERSIQGVR